MDPVKLNDVIFSTHAILACALTIVQCFKYEVSHMKHGVLVTLVTVL